MWGCLMRLLVVPVHSATDVQGAELLLRQLAVSCDLDRKISFFLSLSVSFFYYYYYLFFSLELPQFGKLFQGKMDRPILVTASTTIITLSSLPQDISFQYNQAYSILSLLFYFYYINFLSLVYCRHLTSQSLYN